MRINKIIGLFLLCFLLAQTSEAQQSNGVKDRAFWVATLTRIADPG